MSKLPESSIVREAQQGNQSSFSELVVRYQNLVTSIAFSKTGDLQRSEDIAQQAFVIAWQKLAELKEPARFGAWLRAITRNTVSNSNRKTEKLDRSAKSLETQDEPETLDSPVASLSLQEQQELLWASLKGIPETYREPLVLYYRENKSVDQVASQLGLGTSAVKQRLARGRAMLKGEVHQFVEDILGTSKPGSTFSTGVMAALPAVAGKIAVQSGASTSANLAGKSASNAGLLSPAFGMWAGLFGIIYGMKVASEHANATTNKNFFYWFSKSSTFLTFILISIAMVPFSIGGSATQRTILIIGAIYAGVLAILTICAAFYQKRLNRSTTPKIKNLHALQPAEPAEFKKAITCVTLGCWCWLFFLANVSFDWLTLAISILLICISYKWRRETSKFSNTVPDQMRFQSVTFAINSYLSAFVFFMAGQLGRPTQLFDRPNWHASLLVVLLGTIIAGSIWHSANKFQMELEREGQANAQASLNTVE